MANNPACISCGNTANVHVRRAHSTQYACKHPDCATKYFTIRDDVDVSAKREVEFTSIPGAGPTYDELKASAMKRATRVITHDHAKKWRGIRFQDDAPVALSFIGDPHVDDDGCNWPLLDHDTAIIKNTPGMYAANLGDTTNNWVGRLARLYANQETTAAQAWVLAEGWLNELREKWLILVQGNHDAWSGSGDPIKWIMSGHPAADVYEWNVRVSLEFPGCDPVRIWAAHNFKGHSQFHTLHGMIKARLWHGNPADIFAAGHLHEWGHMSHEPTPGRAVHYLRARGYKFADHYADDLQFSDQKHGASITAVILPGMGGAKRITIFADVEQAAEFLTLQRQKRAA